MSLGQEIIVLGVKRYGFTNDSGERIEGTQVTYVEDFDYTFEEANMKGIFPMTVVHNSDKFFDKFPTLPGHYEVIFKQKPDKKGRPVTVPVDAKFISAYNKPELKVAK